MRKKLKRIPYGPTIKRIFNEHIYPLASRFVLRSTDSLLMHAVPYWFNADSRSVWACKARTKFQMLGTTKDPDTLANHISIKERTVKRGDELFVRFDSKTTNRIDVEHDGRVFTLTALQYEKIKAKIEMYG